MSDSGQSAFRRSVYVAPRRSSCRRLPIDDVSGLAQSAVNPADFFFVIVSILSASDPSVRLVPAELHAAHFVTSSVLSCVSGVWPLTSWF